jgi:hypothetical protein
MTKFLKIPSESSSKKQSVINNSKYSKVKSHSSIAQSFKDKKERAFKHHKYLLVNQQVRVHVLLPDLHHHRAQVLHLTRFALQLWL